MPPVSDPASSDSAALQFDRAEFVDGAKPSACAACKNALERQFFEVNGAMVCPRCREELLAQQSAGSAPGRFFGALALGSVAAAAGAGAWFAITHITGYELSLVAIFVGWMVGLSIQRGSRGRGGWLYQLMAVFLTYSAIVSTYVPTLVDELRKRSPPPSAAAAAPAPDDGGAHGKAEAVAGAPAAAGETPQAAVSPAEPGGGAPPAPRAPDWFYAVVAVPIAFAAPFLTGFDGILGLVIIGIGLMQAWRMNKRRKLEFTGPYELTPAPAPIAAPGEGSGG